MPLLPGGVFTQPRTRIFTDLLRDHFDLQAEGLRDDEDVREDDCGVEREPADGLQRDLGRQRRRAADLEEVVFLWGNLI